MRTPETAITESWDAVTASLTGLRHDEQLRVIEALQPKLVKLARSCLVGMQVDHYISRESQAQRA